MKLITAVLGILALLTTDSVLGDNTPNTLDAGGQHVTSANCIIDGSLGGIGAVATDGGVAIKSGYVGQLTDVTNVAITAVPAAVNEMDNAQLTGLAIMDDGSVTALAGSEIAWPNPAHPVLSVSAAGMAETMPVYVDTTASVTGLYLGVTGSGMFLVRDASPDNFGIYGGDQVPDAWQVHWFGVRNFDGAADANPDGDPHDNRAEWIALTDPTNPASFFAVDAISNQPPSRMVVFSPSSTSRIYRLQYATNLVTSVWTNLPGAAWAAGSPGQMSLSDTNTGAVRFYRVQVAVP
ncbi:MAG: hypothetical protein K8T26_01130 [Lentisphaerae bacterium]|nr:hypothetical protein [Lentisphaerota bacterium]